jgi:hypothetical protein
MKKINVLFLFSIVFLLGCKKKEKDPFANYEGLKITNNKGETFILPTEKFVVNKVMHRTIYQDFFSYDEIELSFFLNKPAPEYKYLSMKIRADSNGFETGDYSQMSYFDVNAVSYFKFADGSYKDNALVFINAGKLVNFKITEINLSSGKKILKGKLDKAAFYSVLTGWGDDDIRDAEFRVEF